MIDHLRFLPIEASTISSQVDAISLVLLIASIAVLALVFGLIIYLGARYRKGSPHSRRIDPRGESFLEWGWTIGTFVVFLGFFFWGTIVYFRMHVAPPGSMEISVVGKQWMWYFQHPDGTREINELHIPVGRPILLTMASQDVIHSLFVPAFRIKQDLVPGRYTHTWFQATKLGVFQLFCTQYCGTMHADMRGRIIVLSQPGYGAWLSHEETEPETLRALPPAQMGERLFTKLGCVSCHETMHIGPDLHGLYGSQVPLADGSVAQADENYIRDCITRPDSRRVKGYLPVMPSFQGRVSENELLDLVAYIKSLGAGK